MGTPRRLYGCNQEMPKATVTLSRTPVALYLGLESVSLARGGSCEDSIEPNAKRLLLNCRWRRASLDSFA
jgi:hypothetical protein